ncbi:MAG: hypothetical protein JW929_11685 [Anaerolineales bacterium]|nr:hypothetical protein [Anaerolineales bacterium]
MKSYVKFGLIAGIIGFILTLPLAALVGICAPMVALVAGAGAGFLAVYTDKTIVRADGPKFGAMAGIISGLFTTAGQMIGGIAILLINQAMGSQTPFGRVPGFSAEAAELFGYYAGGLGAGCCFGVLGLALGAGAGALAGLLAAPKAEPPPAPLP